MNRVLRRGLTALTATAVAGAGLALVAPATPAHANTAGTGVVINEVYGGGGNTGAPYTNDFIELYNPTSATIDLSTYNLGYWSAAGGSGGQASLNGASIAGHGYFLFQGAAGATVTNKPLPAPVDATAAPSTFNLSGSAGRVVLYTGASTTTIPAATDATVVDFVGYGAAATFEGPAVAPTPSNTVSVSRGGSHADTNNNAADFTTGAPSPMNAASSAPSPLAVAPVTDQSFQTGAAITPFSVVASGGTGPYSYAVQSGNPLPAGLNLAADGTISGTPTTGGTSTVKIDATDSAATPATATVTFTITVVDHPALAVTGPDTVTGNQGVALTPVTVTASGGTAPYSFDATGLPAGLSIDPGTGAVSGTPTAGAGTYAATVTVTDADDATDTVTFNVVLGGPILSIHEIQGIGTLSPYGAQAVTTQGVITSIPKAGSSGFYLEEPTTDPAARDRAEILSYGANPSNAIYVFGSAAGLAVGDSVQVSGQVQEYVNGTSCADASGASVDCRDTTTELGSSSPAKGDIALTVTKLATSLGTVAPYVGPGAGQSAWSGLDTAAEKESHEGELIDMQPTAGEHWTVTDNYDVNWTGEMTLAHGDAQLVTPTEVVDAQDSGAVAAVTADNAARRIILDDGTASGTSTAAGTPYSWMTPTSPIRVGDHVTFNPAESGKVILMEYNDSWRVEARTAFTGDGSAVATFSNGRTDNAAPADVGGDARIGTFNVLNYFPTTGQAFEASRLGTCTYYTDRANNGVSDNTCTITATGQPGPRGAYTNHAFFQQEAKIVTAINKLGASAVSLEEIENGLLYYPLIKTLSPCGTFVATTPHQLPGAPTETTAGTATTPACLPPDWAAGKDGTTAYDPTADRGRDYGPARLVAALNAATKATDGTTPWRYVPSPSLSRQPAAGDQDAIRTAFIYQAADLTPVGESTILTGSAAFANAREPLAQAFKPAGAPDAKAFEIIVNHFKSKGSGANDGTGQGNSNPDRVAQAQALVAFADRMADRVKTQSVFLTGDYNAYSAEDPVQTLEAGGFTELNEQFNGGEYTYSFDGMAGSLDHVFANKQGLQMVTGVDVWQINAQEQVAFEYSRANYNTVDLYDTSQFRASDHNPEIVGLDLGAIAPTPTVVVGGDLTVTTTAAGTVPVRVVGLAAVPTGTVSLSLAGRVLTTATVSADTTTTEDTTDGAATLTLPAGTLGAGDYVLSASYSGPEVSRPALTQFVAHVLAPAPAALVASHGAVVLTTVSARVATRTVHVNRTRPRVVVLVQRKASHAATGTVRVIVGQGKHARTYRGTLHQGRVVVKLRRFATRGLKTVRVVYVDQGITRTATLRLRVRR